MAKSIMQTEKECYLSGYTKMLQKHHIFGGPNRKKSEKYGLWVWLRADLHVGPNSVHECKAMMNKLRAEGQTKFELFHGRTLFMKEFGKSYL